MRFITAVATSLTLLIALPAAAKAPAPAAAPPSGTRYAADSGFDLANASVGAYIGGEFGDADGFYLRGEGSLPIMKLTPTVDLRGVGLVGFTRFSEEAGYFSWSFNIFKVVAAARAQLNVVPKFDAYADLGLGFYYASTKAEISFPGLPTQSATDSAGGVTMRIGVGGLYEINEQTKVGAELGFNPYFGDVDTTEFFIGAGIDYKL